MIQVKLVPIGVMPEKIWKLKRTQELNGAIQRYVDASIPVENEWVEEYNRLIKEVGD